MKALFLFREGPDRKRPYTLQFRRNGAKGKSASGHIAQVAEMLNNQHLGPQ